MNNKKVKTFIFMFVTAALAKGLALVRTMVFANYFGTGDHATAYFAASNLSFQLLDLFLLPLIASTFIPSYVEVEEVKGRNKAIVFANNFMNIVVLLAVIITLLGILFAPYIVKIITPGLNNDLYLLTVDLSRIMFPSIIFGAIAYVCVAFLQANFEFNIPNLISTFFNVVIIGYLLIFGSNYGVYGVSIAMLIGWLGQILIQVPSVIKHKYRFRFVINFKDIDVLKAFKKGIPVILVSLIHPVSNIINTGIAPLIDGGYAISAIEYSFSLYLAISSIFAYTIGSLIFPTLSKFNVKKSMTEFKNLISKALDFILLYSIPISTIIMICGKQIIKFLYERGEFTSYSTSLTSNALIIYCLAIVAAGINEVMNRAFYSLGKTKISFITGFITVIINIILSVILSKYIGVSGIALAYVIATFINSILLVTILNKNIKIIDKYLFLQLFKNLISSLVMGVLMYYVGNMLGSYSGSLILGFMILCLECLVGIIVFIGINLLLKNKMVINICKVVLNKLKDVKNKVLFNGCMR